MPSWCIYVIIAIVLLIVGSAFASASEIAYATTNKIKLEKAASDPKNKKAVRAQKLVDDYPSLLATILVVNNLVINSKDFITTEGWLGNSNLVFQLYPPYTSSTDISTYSAKSYLKLTSGVNFYNAGIRQSSSYLPNGFSIEPCILYTAP